MDFDLELFLPYRLYQAAEKTSQAFHAHYREKYDLSRTEWRVLFNVGQYGPISAVDISKRSNLEKTKISRSVQRLEEREWLRRIFLVTDRRRHQLELTKKGLKVFRELAKLAEEFNNHYAELLGDGRLDELNKAVRFLEQNVTNE